MKHRGAQGRGTLADGMEPARSLATATAKRQAAMAGQWGTLLERMAPLPTLYQKVTPPRTVSGEGPP